MALSPGTRFGPYEVADEIGAGGMGVVYRATDTTLDREVAIKVLPESMAADAERITRFDREAKTLASLNHPNIAQIYGLERSDDTTALVMELVEGPTLADRIEQGAIPADEALGIAMQIAEALEAAHGQNIVHRDLKPANIKLRPDGTVKVLDFGIAKALEPDNLTTAPPSPMLTTPATQVGVILGTAAYMSPEQARGKAVDERTDIWAFGCVLYEMLTGQPAFGGEDVPITLARVLTNDTDMESLPAAISPAVHGTIQVCLQKDVRKRVADIRDVRLALEGAFETISPRAVDAATQPTRRRTLPFAVTAVVAILVTCVAAWSLWPLPDLVVTRFSIDLEAALPTSLAIALSRDGRRIVYAAGGELYSRRMDQDEATVIPGTEGAQDPFFSPDGEAVAFFTSTELKAAGFVGEEPRVLADIEPARGLVGGWDREGRIFFGQQGPYGLSWVPAVGGTPEPFADLADYQDLDYPDALPGGEWVLFSANVDAGTWSDAEVVAQNIATGERRVLLEGGHFARYVSSGHLVFARGGTLYAVAFDSERVEVMGSPVPLVQDVATNEAGGHAQFAIASNGTLIYVRGDFAAAARTLVWVDRTGREAPLAAPPRAYVNPRISPDGTTVALDIRDRDFDIWTWDFDRETLTRLTFDPGQDEFPVWSPDGRQIAFSSTGDGGTSLNWRAADGSGSVERLAESSGQIFSTSFLPDATGILVFGTVTNGDDIAIVRLEDEERATPMLETTFEESYPQVSPDGRWLAYVSDESGSEEIYVRPFPNVDSGGRWQVSTGGGTQPLWAHSGHELFYRNGEAVIAVPIETDPSFTQGNPEVMFEGNYLSANGGPNYDVSSDGERFLMIGELEGASEIIVVLNWITELERLAPAAD